jgi:REP element-mobilizing transposase RayT/CheY-like chemotaxis protein
VINFNQMPADILVVTPSKSLGESVRRTLEDTTLYRVHVVDNKASAVVRADQVGIPLAMLDFALGVEGVDEIARGLRTMRTGINLILLCDEKDTPPAFDDLRPWILVRKPFSMTNFMTAISAPHSAAQSQPREEFDPSVPLWLRDKNKAAQRLTRITLSSASQAALITRKHDLWAYAGGLEQPAAKEVAEKIVRYWDAQKGADLLRFIRLESTKAEHMLYATRLADDTVLALVFDAETPFSTIRHQASQLVADIDSDQAEAAKREPIPEAQTPPPAEPVEEDNIPPITNIIMDVPSPNPEPGAARKKREADFDPDQTRVSTPLSNASVFNRDASSPSKIGSAPRRSTPAPKSQPVMNVAALDDMQVAPPQVTREDVKAKPISQPVFTNLEVTAPSRPKERPSTPLAKPVSELDATRESPTTEAARKLVVEPVSAGMYHLTYACLLVPRFTSHYLTGDLSERMSEWVPNICIAFGWRLEFISVRPEYLQWVVNVQPSTSPGGLMRVMRQQTSEKIFAEFPRFKRENTASDFWAPGYLIMAGTQPHPPQLVKDYINQTRQRQGLETK